MLKRLEKGLSSEKFLLRIDFTVVILVLSSVICTGTWYCGRVCNTGNIYVLLKVSK